jgi:hypothetical protein
MSRTSTSVPASTATSLARSAAAVAAYFGALFACLEGIAERVTTAYDEQGVMTSATVSELIQPLVAETLAAHPVVGAGFVASPDWLSDREHYLAWWQGEDQRLLAERGVPIGHHVFDYTRHEWFQTPLATGLRHVAGPYVDYVCTDEYVLTATVPVLVHGRMAGVAGADTLLETFEGLMREDVRADDAVVVNGHDRVVVAADPLLRSGQRVDTTSYAEEHAFADLPFRVLRRI